MAALNYLRDSSHLWGNPTDSPLCPTCSRRGRRVAGALLPEITWQRNLAAVVSAPGWYLVQRLLLQTEPVIATEQSQGFQADVLMPGRNKGLFSQMVQDHSEEDGCVSKEHFRVVGTGTSKQKRLSTRLNLCPPFGSLPAPPLPHTSPLWKVTVHLSSSSGMTNQPWAEWWMFAESSHSCSQHLASSVFCYPPITLQSHVCRTVQPSFFFLPEEKPQDIYLHFKMLNTHKQPHGKVMLLQNVQ